ncbi:DUF4945 domain-containing protein [Parapedobacter tibetensis]|uniref:DUF4945 domain-containing protein n=1 Tax=Parapedobacter tibetensis TaxID=2972951 RepID=UPI00214D59DB|nr:DUF4945 domain-containing protein [Parapedobacter tibetensis]
MVKLVHVVGVALSAILLVGCYDRDIIDYKEFGYSLPNVKNLAYSRQGDLVTLTWEIPESISAGFRRPLEVSIQKVENGVYREIIMVHGESTSRDIAIDANKTYRFVVKLAGYLTDDVRATGKPDRVYSEGEVLEIQ